MNVVNMVVVTTFTIRQIRIDEFDMVASGEFLELRVL